MTVAASYPEGKCPDCDYPIPMDAESGDACPNCGHIWYPIEPEPFDMSGSTSNEER